MTVDNDLPNFPKVLHSIGTHLQRKTSIYQAFEGVLLMGKSAASPLEFPKTRIINHQSQKGARAQHHR